MASHSGLITGGGLALAAQQPPARDAGTLATTNENMKPNPTSVLLEKPREEFHSLNNNNDSRYLHKKFKKMASVIQPVILQVDGDLGRTLIENASNHESTSHLSSFQDVSTGKRPMDLESIYEYSPVPVTTFMANSTTKLSVSRSMESENNVQINLREFSDKSVRDGRTDCYNHDVVVGNSVESKMLGTSDFQDSCEANMKDSSSTAGNGRHVCPYCKLSCAKPSVLQKHIRAHTNERPYPCVPCGFAFKTKSNLYKHRRSRSHALRLQGSEDSPSIEEDWSLGSEADVVNGNHPSRSDSAWASDRTNAGDALGLNDNSFSELSAPECVSPPSNSGSQTDSRPKTIYKPKFHKANFYHEDDEASKSVLATNTEFLNRHISKIISDNEAIVDTIDSPLHRKYIKDSSSQKTLSNEVAANSFESLKNDIQPLNLTKNSESTEAAHRKRCYSESFAQPDILSSKAPQHPLNPEGSIIKDLLLKARAQATGLLPVTSETYDASETLYICPLCQIPYRSADNLEIHRLYYCKGQTFKLNNKPEHNYTRSNSIHVTLPETYNPNTLAKLASSTLKTPPGRLHKPENLVIFKTDNEISAPLPSPGPLLGNTRLVDSHRALEAPRSSFFLADNSKFNTSPFRRREESSSAESLCSVSKSEESLERSDLYSPPAKIRCSETPTTLRSLEELSLSPMRQNSTSLQMFGGEVKIVDNSGGTTTMRIEPTTSQQSPTMISQSRASPKAQGPETSSIVVRSGLHSGGTIVHNPPTPKEPLPSPHPQTPRMLVSIAPNISTPNLTVAGIPAPNMTKFQFPPIGSITAYNPLTLPPLSPAASPCGASTILHGGKLIPYVPGIPGPNSLNSYLPSSQTLSLNMVKSIQALNNGPELSPRGDTNSTEKSKMNKLSYSDTDFNLKFQPLSKYKNSNGSLPSPNTELKESPWKSNNWSQSSPKAKLSIPTIQIICEASSPITLQNTKTDASPHPTQNFTQNKIDEIVRRNTEILQKSSTNFSESPRENKVLLLNNSVKSVALSKIIGKNKMIDENYLEVKQNENLTPETSKQFNFENLISKSEILNKSIDVVVSDGIKLGGSARTLKSDEALAKTSERSETSYFKKSINALVGSSKFENEKPKFLRPSSLPLKPGTFTPKRHHGITPNANTLPLISPETPRPAKAYGQLYLNGHAYTYLGLKCSTKVYYCTLNRPQPTYVPNQHSLSMYSNWQVCSDSTPNPLGLTPGKAMGFYDSRHRPQNFSIANIKQDHLMTHSSQWTVTVAKPQEPSNSETDGADEPKIMNGEMTVMSNKTVKSLKGGFESNEEYTYVRGRGRGRYVCSECGIRCKKPSMLKKHIRTHTDVRPFTCKHCAFSFKTKGNLTKHMKSKAHYKKCVELGISPHEDAEGSEGGEGGDGSQGMGESDEDSDSEDDGNEGETESSDTDSWKSRLEHEAAHCLLSLWGGRPAPGLLSTARPTTYPYTPNPTDPHIEDITCTRSEESLLHRDSNQSVIRKQISIQTTTFKMDKSPGNSRQSNQLWHPIDLSKPMDLSKGDTKECEIQNEQRSVWYPATDILTPVGEPDLLASLVQSTAKLPQRTNDWRDDEPMLQAYLTEKALQDSKIKQSQYTMAQSRQIEVSSALNDKVKSIMPKDNSSIMLGQISKINSVKEKIPIIIHTSSQTPSSDASGVQILVEIAAPARSSSPPSTGSETTTSTENAKFVASEYLKVVCGKSNDPAETQIIKANSENRSEKTNGDAGSVIVSTDEINIIEKDSELAKIASEHIGIARKVVVGAGGVGFKLTSPSNEFSSVAAFAKGHLTEDGRSVCVVCNKTFSKPSQLRLHINIHYMERPFRCSACAVSFRTRGHLQKHERSGSHHNKVSMTSTFGAATTTNPRPFKCSDCKIAFRIHGHLAKHLRSKMHVMRLECLGKLPFGTFAEIERAGVSLTDIDTTDCDNSLASLQILAQKLHEKDPTKLEKWDPVTMAPPLLPPGPDSSDEDEPSSPHAPHTSTDGENKTVNDSDSTDETNVKYSATDT